MSIFVVKQPNGMYCIFSTIVDDVIEYNLKKRDLMQWFVRRAKAMLVEELERPGMTFDEMKRSIRRRDKAYKEILKRMSDNIKTTEEK
jgi:hypothetical protein